METSLFIFLRPNPPLHPGEGAVHQRSTLDVCSCKAIKLQDL
jgi:hypothetical protein